jgi:hypothetical protein
MKFLKRFEEINPKDIAFISDNLDDYFTIAFEFEIETDDTTGYVYDFSEIDDDLIEEVHDEIKSELKLRKNDQKIFLRNICDTITLMYEEDELSESSFEEIFDKSPLEFKEIAEHLKSNLLSQIIANDFNYLKEKAQIHLKSFFDKWEDEVEFIPDVTLTRGIEIKPKNYVVGISRSIEMIEDFYTSLKSQTYWKFDTTTGLHINIGSTQKIKWNPIKGLLLMNDYSKNPEQVPLVFKDMIWRQNNRFCGSLLSSIYKMSDVQKEKIKNKIDFKDISEVETFLNDIISKRLIDQDPKNFGFNLTRLKLNYIEFRYVGGDIDKDVLIDKLKYFCFLVYCMTNETYKSKEYLTKIYKFVDTL